MIKLLKKCEREFFTQQFSDVPPNNVDPEMKLENVFTDQSKLDFLFPPQLNTQDDPRRPKSLLKNTQNTFVSLAETQRAIRKHL